MVITSWLICAFRVLLPMPLFVDRFSSGSLNLSDLCITSGDSCWVIYADLMCLNYDGNLTDACLLALVQSLRRLQLPETEVVEEAQAGGRGGAAASEVCISSTNFRKLPFHHTITATTFGVIDESVEDKKQMC